MTFTLPAFAPAIPEMFLLGMTCFILVVDVFLSDRRRMVTYWLSLITIVATAWLTVTVAQNSGMLTFNGMFVNDSMGNVLKLFTYLMVAIALLYSRDYLVARNLFKGEFYVLGLTGIDRKSTRLNSSHH